ncbi:sensor domain-containing diguanylate cyclase [Mycobacteroides chelonae]|uniref:sensor domain-containing diguanylate cyclase n=1 Tax=Mycobacteroides chelonae TaxID=1774 RepID=UPI0009931650|nr:sensor domain-containing diguanylate cyclase [Mycobacteroides chelonae]
MTYGMEYAFATRGLKVTRNLVRLKTAIGMLCMSMAVLGVLVQFHPLGPQGLWPRIIHGTAVASSFVVGVCWIVLPWPKRRTAIAFVCWADVSIAVGAFLCSAPASRLGATSHMGLIGVFAAFLLGWQVLAAHCVFATCVIAAMTAWNVYLGDATWFEQYIYNAPALSSVVLLPIIIQTVIEGGRRGLKAITLAAHQDPLTGLLNRRGVQLALSTMLYGRPTPRIVAVVLIDVDFLKVLNDTLGHEAGDESISSVGRMLAAAARASDITARVGGDEFMVVAFHDNVDDAARFVDRVTANNSGIGSHNASVSVGSAWQSTGDNDFDFDILRRRADEALCQAKRTRSRNVSAAPQVGSGLAQRRR